MVEKILIVEDNFSVRNLIDITLGYGKYKLYDAENAEEALALYNRIKPEICVLDIMLPGLVDGLQLCEIIKKSGNNTFVILTTAKGQDYDVKAGRNAGADAYVIKPFSPQRLIEIIEHDRLSLSGSDVFIQAKPEINAQLKEWQK